MKDPAGELTGSMLRLDPRGDRRCRGSEDEKGVAGVDRSRVACWLGGARKKTRTRKGGGSRVLPELSGGEGHQA